MTEITIDHEVRLRILERTATGIHKLLCWILGTTITIGIPVILNSFGYLR